jgi:TRAP-type transport system small permease protein
LSVAPTPATSVLGRLEGWAAALAGVGVLVMMLLGGIDVVTTKMLDWPIPGAYELTETMMVGSVFLALALSQREKRQIRVELFTERFSERWRRVFDAVADLCSLVVYGLIAWFGVRLAWTSISVGEFSSGLIQLPLWPAKTALALGALLMCAQCASNLVVNLRAAMPTRA